MIGSKLITKQTGAGGRLCSAVSFLFNLQPNRLVALADNTMHLIDGM